MKPETFNTFNKNAGLSVDTIVRLYFKRILNFPLLQNMIDLTSMFLQRMSILNLVLDVRLNHGVA